jgi:hypothetical protein
LLGASLPTNMSVVGATKDQLIKDVPVSHRSTLALCFVALLSLNALGACGGEPPAPLVGTWTFAGSVPAIVKTTLTFHSDKTFVFMEDVAPPTTPAGSVSDGCIVTDTLSATYAEGVTGDVNTLTWKFTHGTANAVSGCNAASNDSPGTPMTSDAISDYIDEGLVPPMAVTYLLTSTTLALTPGLGPNTTTFTKAN